jgi:phage-related protein (TIGR01555 family)
MALLDIFKNKVSKGKAMDNSIGYNRTVASYAGQTGGLRNYKSGMGSSADKGRGSFFTPTFFSSRAQLEIINTESWACKRFVNLPIDQMFLRPRTLDGISEDNATSYLKYLQKYKINDQLSRAMKCGRLFGSGYMIFITKEAPLNTPLYIDSLRRGDLLNILSFDRFSVNVSERCIDIASQNYQKPEYYHVTPMHGKSFKVHASRVLRFDGIQSLGDDGWTTYNLDYGVSEIVPILQSIYQDAQCANGVSQLIEEASIPVLKMQEYKETLGKSSSIDSPSLDEIQNSINEFKSTYRMMFLDSTDDFSRQEVNFSSIPQVLDCFAGRLAAAAGIQQTIFLTKSPAGMNATGESDLAINAASVAAQQEKDLRPALEIIDEIMTRTGGYTPNSFTFDFPSLIDISDEVQAQTSLTRAQAVMTAGDIMTADEQRAALSGDSLFGNLEPEDTDFSATVAQQKLADQQAANQPIDPNASAKTPQIEQKQPSNTPINTNEDKNV